MPKHKSLKELAPIIGKCVRCSVCKFPPLALVESREFSYICPAHLEYKFHGHSGGGKLLMAMSLVNERLDTVSDEAREVIFQCTLCGGCDMTCKFASDIEVLEGIYALRAESFKRAGPLPGHKAILDELESSGRAFPCSFSKGDWIRTAGLNPGLNGHTLLFVGDRFALSGDRQQSLMNLIDLLKQGGTAFGLLGDDEPTTGRAALDIGHVELFSKLASRTAEVLKNTGVTSIICADALDYNTMRAHLPKVTDLGDIKVAHAVEVLDQLIRKGKIKPRKRLVKKVAFHDPCTLGRLSEPYAYWNGRIIKVMGQLIVYDPPRTVNRGTWGCYEPPRRLLAAIPGLETVEFERRKERSFCCGGEGLANAAGYSEFVFNTASHRLAEARAVGAETVVTACPNCDQNLGLAAKNAGIEIVSIYDLLAESVRG